MRRLHLIVGLASVLAFLASGQCMNWRYEHLHGLDDTTRMLFRSTHIYILFAALLNVMLGLYLVESPPGWRFWLQRAGSILILLSPPLLITAFLIEPWLPGLQRPYSQPTIIACFAGCMAHLLSRWPMRRSPTFSSESAMQPPE